ncbi:MAG: histidine kinase dimerization/phospho-acceptor domain-containing protein [Desulfobacterales bacterium]|nr:histidine kinase dimerization/phospho-acceptor domain-containing protein [Desulfobacterales bacterium]
MKSEHRSAIHDFKGIGFSKIGHFKEVRSKIKELENLNIKLAKRGNRLEAMFHSMSDGVTILDRNLNIVFANHVQKNMFPDVSLIGEKCFSSFYRKNKICKNCPSLKTIQTRETQRGEILIKTGEFSGRYLEWTTSPISDRSGKVDEIVLLMRDITERKEYEFRLMQADRMAAIGFLAAGIAHELNNPLTSIAGFSEGLLKRLAKMENELTPQHLSTFNDYLNIVNDEAYRCKAIIQNLQDFSKSSEDEYETIRIDEILDATASLFRQHAKDNNITVTIKNDLSTGFNQILGIESQLKHVFLNLFNNAFKAMKEGGELTVLAKNEGNSIEIRIADTRDDPSGEALFELYERSCLGKPIGKTSRLDLSICLNIIQHHQGEFSVVQNKPRGVIFVLRFAANLT